MISTSGNKPFWNISFVNELYDYCAISMKRPYILYLPVISEVGIKIIRILKMDKDLCSLKWKGMRGSVLCLAMSLLHKTQAPTSSYYSLQEPPLLTERSRSRIPKPGFTSPQLHFHLWRHFKSLSHSPFLSYDQY